MSKTTGCRTCDGSGEVYAGIEALLADCPDCTTPAPDHAQARRYAKVVSSDAHFEEPLKVNLARAYLALAASPQEGREAWCKRVKVDVRLLDALANESEPVTFRAENEPGGDVMLVMTRHECPPVAPLPPVVTPPTDDEALDLWRAVKRNHAEEADAVVMFTRLLTAALAERPRD